MVGKEILQRRVAGWHDYRMDGLTDLLLRARGATVLDLGCNRGMVCLEFAQNGARLVHGVDNYEEGIATARGIFADNRAVQSQFEVADLSLGPPVLAPFGGGDYDIVTILATTHKLARQMKPEDLDTLIQYLGRRTLRYFAWRGERENVAWMSGVLAPCGLKKIHESEISDMGTAVIWERK